MIQVMPSLSEQDAQLRRTMDATPWANKFVYGGTVHFGPVLTLRSLLCSRLQPACN